jgi:phosphoribosylamine--glycine ligase
MGRPFQGVLYAGLMIVKGEPYVLEFNARLGDPETQAVLPLLKTDLLDVVEAVVEHRLDQLPIEWRSQTAVCVVMASDGYPGSYRSGDSITGLPDDRQQQEGGRHTIVFHAGTRAADGSLVTAGGRVLGVTGLGPTLLEARERAYAAVKPILFDGRHFRSDIAMRALRLSHA